MAIKSSSQSETTPLYQGSFLRRGLKQRLKDDTGYEVPIPCKEAGNSVSKMGRGAGRENTNPP